MDESAGNISVYEDEEKIYVEAALPGLKAEDLQIHFEKGFLSIKGERKEERGNAKVHMQAKTNFSYCVTLPNRVDEHAAIDAVMKDGIVKITFPKSRAVRSQRIEVKTAT